MDSLRLFIINFIRRGGIIVFASSILNKLIYLIMGVIVIRIVDTIEYSKIAYAYSVFSILIIVIGLGANYSLLRFGSVLDSFSSKIEYLKYSIKKGTFFSVGYISIIILACIIFNKKIYSYNLIILSSFALLSYFWIDLIKNYFRIINKNRLFSKINIYHSISILFCTLPLTYYFKSTGYFIALIIAPLIIFLIFFRRFKYTKIRDIKITPKFWTYGIHTSITSFVNQIIFSLGPIFIAYMSTEEKLIASYKVATIIPFNLLFFPDTFMKSDFPIISKNSFDKRFLIDYYKNYLKLTLSISVILFPILLFFGKDIITLIFGSKYLDCIPMYNIFIIAVFFTFLFRNPLGNILLAVGKANWNGYVSYVTSTLYIILCLVFYPFYSVNGVVYSLAFIFFIQGFISLFLFRKYLNLISKHESSKK